MWSCIMKEIECTPMTELLVGEEVKVGCSRQGMRDSGTSSIDWGLFEG